jgi:dihydrofolate reductase
MQMSVDGFVSTKELSLDWLVWDWSDNWTWDEKLKTEFNRIFGTIGCILLSRKMVEDGYIDHWSKAAKNFPRDPKFAFAKKITDTQKVIFSKTLSESKWDNATIADGDLVQEINKLKSESGADIIAFGGVGFASALVAANVVDEFQFFVNPRVLGAGRSIFAKRSERLDLKLLSSEGYECGIVLNKYTPT